MKRARLLLADYHRLVLEGLQRILEPEFEVAGMVEDGKALLAAAPRLRADVILVDLSLPLLNGIDAARQLRAICPESKLIFVTMHAAPAFVRGAFLAGASGYVLKSSTAKELVKAVRIVVRGGMYVSPELKIDLRAPWKDAASQPGSLVGSLTPRQRGVLQLAAEGRSNKDIAALLNLSVKGVEYHKSAIARALRTKKSAEWTRYAVAAGLVGP